jgi:hypothetical protein
MMNRAKKVITFTLITALFCLSIVPQAHSQSVTELGDAFNNFSNASAYLLPAFVFGMTLIKKDKPGTVQFVESAGLAMGITFTLKYTINTTRPNGEPHSFPSGHATITVASAEFLRKRYGWKYGLPAYFVASYVGYDRIRTNVHYPIDVLGGATIAFVSTYVITKPYKGWTFQPVVDGNNCGIRISRVF